MPRYDQLFQEIVHTIKEDYAGFAMGQEHHDPRPYVHTIGTAFMKKELDADLFYRQVNQYLAETDDRNLRFSRRPDADYQPVSYTHLDVYKRQVRGHEGAQLQEDRILVQRHGLRRSA